MTLTLAKISAQKAQAKIAREFGGAFGDVPLRRGVAADHIRSALYASAVLASTHNLPSAVHTSRLLTAVRKTLDLVWPGAAVEHLDNASAGGGGAQQTLDSLRVFGDIFDIGGGYWLGTPLRFVRSDDALLALGAAPNAVLKTSIRARPICAGISRFWEVRSKELSERTISISQWLGHVEDITTWTKRILDQHEQRMQSSNDIPADQLEIYAPDYLPKTQNNPWMAAQAISRTVTEARLCRPIKTFSRMWDRPFYLSHFRSSGRGLVVERSVRVEYGLTRRLRFGLSKLYGCPQIVIGAASGALVHLEMPVALPDPEARISALGWPLLPNSRRTVFHQLALPFLTEAMRRLAVQILVR